MAFNDTRDEREHAVKLGFTLVDGGNQHRTSYERGEWRVWYCRDGWRRARLSGNGSDTAIRYRDHMPFVASLRDALDQTPTE